MLWTQGGKVITASGSLVDCATCPCVTGTGTGTGNPCDPDHYASLLYATIRQNTPGACVCVTSPTSIPLTRTGNVWFGCVNCLSGPPFQQCVTVTYDSVGHTLNILVEQWFSGAPLATLTNQTFATPLCIPFTFTDNSCGGAVGVQIEVNLSP